MPINSWHAESRLLGTKWPKWSISHKVPCRLVLQEGGTQDHPLGPTKAPSHQSSISYYWPNPPPEETNTEPQYGIISQGIQPATWVNWLLWIPSTWGVCDCGVAIHSFQNWFMLSLWVHLPHPQLLQQHYHWKVYKMVIYWCGIPYSTA